MQINAVDLFCGAGGLTHGFLKEGITVKAGIDIDAACRFPYEANNASEFIEKDVSAVSVDSLREILKGSDYTVLAGCAPCQPFSKYTQGLDSERDERWSLLDEFLRLAVGVKPDVVTMENVTQLKKHAIYSDFVIGLKKVGYFVTEFEIDCTKIGIPQTRRRLVLFASHYNDVKLHQSRKSTKAKTVRQAIGTLPPIGAGDVYDADPLHCASRLCTRN
jgi:DNA (cytosine-5)-methyltransferase 1